MVELERVRKDALIDLSVSLVLTTNIEIAVVSRMRQALAGLQCAQLKKIYDIYVIK